MKNAGSDPYSDFIILDWIRIFIQILDWIRIVIQFLDWIRIRIKQIRIWNIVVLTFISNMIYTCQVRGTTKYHLSPFEQRAFAGAISKGIPNTLWRIRYETPTKRFLTYSNLINLSSFKKSFLTLKEQYSKLKLSQTW